MILSGRRLILYSTDMETGVPGCGNRIPVYLSPGRAFGSGLHETTASCLQALEELDPAADWRVLDVGAGTGILSLAALALGARSAVALDIDRDAAQTCLRSAHGNTRANRMKVFQGTLEALRPTLKFELIVANIYGDIILDQAQKLKHHLAEEGFMILSGIDYGDNRPIREAMTKLGMENRLVRFLDDYVTQVWFNPRLPVSGGP